ncbi:D-tagatose-bisphosphate aldolase, class II, non-catalytic subunit [Nibricoccus sp. IMCC34717]|uniref:D-tagatose-bisphosphate aldolase, class II, non-catalytic subunit n=1 Tax=Nibricoccus sp. IMCC34717 TaxID=3034021 RepID=UPI00384CA601
MKTSPLIEQIRLHKAGYSAGVYCVCSANRYVMEAAVEQAIEDGSFVLIESTSNQVDQFGGYMGMTPAQFAAYARKITEDLGLDPERLILGGDHLGPNRWQKEPAAEAMRKSLDLIAAYVEAGYTKIHLDASMRCADDPEVLPVATVAARAAAMCRVAEATAARVFPKGHALYYIVGTEVPVPGGAREEIEGLQITRVADLEETLNQTRLAFVREGVASAWERVIGVVVQPGVEFDDHQVIEYDPAKATQLSAYIEKIPGMVFEAHSTDYQSARSLHNLVRDHFSILKVGPGLTFAFREAVFALEEIERAWLAVDSVHPLSSLHQVLEEEMLRRPEYWKNYYHGDPSKQSFSRKFSTSDRSRYYWAEPKVAAALETLLANLAREPIPMALVSQYLPNQYRAVREGAIPCHPVHLLRHKIKEVLSDYSAACGIKRSLGRQRFA